LDNGAITEIAPGDKQSIFATGLDKPHALAFNNAGDLFAANGGGNDILEFTPNGTESTFATGLDTPVGLAFEGQTLPVPEPPVLGLLAAGAAALVVRRRRLRG
jgi:hypothetical protein